MARDWPVDNQHYNNSSNFYTWRRKYFFYDKNTDTFDMNDSISRIQAVMSNNSSHIIEGLQPEAVAGEDAQIRVGLGSFFHVPSSVSSKVFEQPYFEGITPSNFRSYTNNLHHNASLVHVGEVREQLTQTSTTNTVHTIHNITTGTLIDPSYGIIPVNNPTVYTAADSVKATNYYDSLGTTNKRQINLNVSGSSGLGTGRDVYTSYMPDVKAKWETPTNEELVVVEPSSGQDGSKVIKVATTLSLDDIGKTVEVKTSTVSGHVGQKRKIIRIVSDDTFEVDEAFNVSSPSYLIGDTTLYIYDGESQLTSGGTRYDILGIRRKTYEIQKVVLNVDETGLPSTDTDTARYFTTWELVVIEDVDFVDASMNEIDFTNLTSTDLYLKDKYEKLAEIIPLALVETTATTATIVSVDKPWITSFRNRVKSNENLITNGNFINLDPSLSGSNNILGMPNGQITDYPWEVYGSAVVYPETNQANVMFGDKALRVSKGSDSRVFLYKKKLSELGLTKGDIVSFSAWVKNISATNVSLRVSVWDYEDTPFPIAEIYSGKVVTRTDSYEMLEAAVTVPMSTIQVSSPNDIDENTYLVCVLEMQGAIGVEAYTDGWKATVLKSSSHGEIANLTDTGAQYIGGSLTVSGNLIVLGGQSIIEAETVTIADPTLVLNSGGTSGTANGAGITIEATTASWTFNTANNRWDIGSSHGLYVGGQATLNNVTINDGSITGCDITIPDFHTLDLSAPQSVLDLGTNTISGNNVTGGTIDTVIIDNLSTNNTLNANNISAASITSLSTINGSVSGTSNGWDSNLVVTLGGDLSGAITFNGPGNITSTIDVLDDSHNHTTWLDNVTLRFTGDVGDGLGNDVDVSFNGDEGVIEVDLSVLGSPPTTRWENTLTLNFQDAGAANAAMGSVTFDGDETSLNVPLTIADDSHNHANWTNDLSLVFQGDVDTTTTTFNGDEGSLNINLNVKDDSHFHSTYWALGSAGNTSAIFFDKQVSVPPVSAGKFLLINYDGTQRLVGASSGINPTLMTIGLPSSPNLFKFDDEGTVFCKSVHLDVESDAERIPANFATEQETVVKGLSTRTIFVTFRQGNTSSTTESVSISNFFCFSAVTSIQSGSFSGSPDFCESSVTSLVNSGGTCNCSITYNSDDATTILLTLYGRKADESGLEPVVTRL